MALIVCSLENIVFMLNRRKLCPGIHPLKSCLVQLFIHYEPEDDIIFKQWQSTDLQHSCYINLH